MNPDDPKFTAHALGEVEDLTAAERAEIEALLASDPAAQAEAEETRALAARLRAELPGEEAGALHDEQRAAVFSAATAKSADQKIVRFPMRAWALAAAACVVIGISAAMLFSGGPPAESKGGPSMALEEPTFSAPVVDPSKDLRGLVANNPTPFPISPEAPQPAPALLKSGEATLVVTATSVATATGSRSLGDLATDRPTSAPAPAGAAAMPDSQAASSVPMAAKSQAYALAPQAAAPFSIEPSAPRVELPTAGGALAMNKDAAAPPTARLGGSTDGGAAHLADAKERSALKVTDKLTASAAPVPTVPAAPMSVTGTGTTSGLAGAVRADADHGDGAMRPSTKATPGQAMHPDGRPLDAPPAVPVAPSLAMASGGAFSKVGSDKKTMTLAPTMGGKDPYQGSISEPQTAEMFDELAENAFLTARETPLSTFSIDVDTASYSIVRRFLNNQQQPPKGAVRIEELLNYFTYDYELPQGDAPFSAAMEVSACPWAPGHRLVRIGLKGREIARDRRPASNLVFLIDVSGSMMPENKLPLLKQSLGLLIDQLGSEDQVAIVVYAGSSGCVLDPTHDKRKMHAALSKLEAGGSTNGGSGIQLAYHLAEKSFIRGGTNRVILATDGDWNVGITDHRELLDLIKRKAKSGVFLTVLGVGMDNLKDAMLVKLADSGNGNYAYLDTLMEAKKVLVEQLSGTLVTIAKDVKIQVEFNPAQVGSYRLIGYEKRMLAKQDFNDDKKDAGEIGAGHTVTALYEIVPAGQQLLAMQKAVDPLKYQPAPAPAAPAPSDPEAPAAPAVPSEPAPTPLPVAAPLPTLPRPRLAATPTNGRPLLSEDKSSTERAKEEIAPKLFDEKPTAEGQKLAKGEQRDAAGEADARTRQLHPETKAAGAALAMADKAKADAGARLPVAVRNELLTLKLRYKEPEGDTSKLLEFPLTDRGTPWEQSSRDFRFAAAVAGYGMLLRDSPYKGEMTWSAVAEWATEGKGTDVSGYRAEFLGLLDKARAVSR